MRELNFPTYEIKVKREADKLQIFDRIRKKWVILQPEEWVRQHIIWFLIEDKNYPPSLIAVEKSLKVNQLLKRFDLVLYDTLANPIMIIECKAPEIEINENTLHQALRYNSVIKAPYVVLTNGITTYCGIINFSNASFSYLNDIPNYNEIR